MCAVVQNALAPIGNGPPPPADYSTACSCDAIVCSVVAEGLTTMPSKSSDGSCWSETATVKTVPDLANTPRDCCVECLVTAKDVQTIYWPVETAKKLSHSSTITVQSRI